MNRIADDQGTLKHDEEIAFFNALVIDLKKRELGIVPDEPITMERLQTATYMIGKLFVCRDKTSWKRAQGGVA